jgi:hypothetical protein
VNKAPLSITASSVTVTYGTTPTVTPSYAGFVNGEGPAVLSTPPTCSGGSATTPVGTYAGATSCSGATADNYTISYANGNLTVDRAPLIITASNGTMTYGGTPPTITPSYAGFVNAEGPSALTTAPACSGGSSTTPAGTYAGATSCSGATAANYSISYMNGTLTVAKAPLSFVADDKSKVYGQPVPGLTYTVSGFVNGESASVLSGAPVLSTAATATSDVGTYPITITAGSLAAANYSFAFANGTLTITPASTALVAAPVLINLSPLALTLGKVSAKLTFGGQPVVGQTIVFTAGATELCTATTSADGTAGCTLTLAGALAVVANLSYTATFNGSLNFLPSSAKGPLIR